MKKLLALVLVVVILFSGCAGTDAFEALSNLDSQQASSNSQTSTPSESSETSSSGSTGKENLPSQTVNCGYLEDTESAAYGCSSNEDCTIYINKCCSLLSNGINKNYKSCIHEVNVDILGNPCTKTCNSTDVPTFVICANNKCMPVFENITQTYNPPIVTCSTDDDCELSLCNCQCQEKGFDKGICAIIMPPTNCIDNVGISGCKCTDGKCVTIS